MLLAVMMLCVLAGCKDAKPGDGKDTPTTTTPQTVAPIELVEGQIPADCLFGNDPEAIVHDHTVLLKANAPLTKLQFLALNPDPSTVDRVLFGHDSLDEGQCWAIHTYLNDIENIGFVSLNEYTCPEEASLSRALYDGAGIGTPSPNRSEDELKEYSDVTGLKKDEMVMPVYRFARADVEALILEKLGIPSRHSIYG